MASFLTPQQLDWVIQLVTTVVQEGSLEKIGKLLEKFSAAFPDDAFSAKAIQDLVVKQLTELAKVQIVEAGKEKLISLLFPGGALIVTLFKGLQWATQNLGVLADLVGTVGAALRAAGENPTAVMDLVLAGFKKFTVVALGLFATLLIGNFKDKIAELIRCALDWLRARVQRLIDWLIDSIFKNQKGTTGSPCALKTPPGKVPTPTGKGKGCSGKRSCFGVGTLVEGPEGRGPIEGLSLGQLVRADGPVAERARTATGYAPGQEWRFREVVLYLDKEDVQWLRARLLLDVGWLREQGVEIGGSLWLELEEVGEEGWMRVLEINPCPPLPMPLPGYRLVTGWFAHSSGVVCDLRVQGESKPIRATPTHPIWSVDEGAWVQVQELRQGERLLASDGSTPVVEMITLREQGEPVYNIEVEGDHCYRVGQQGLLVHNASAPQVCNPAAGSVVYDPVKTVTFMDAGGNAVSGDVGTGVIAYLTPANVGLPRVDLDEPNWWSKLQAVAGGPIQLGHILASSLGGKGKKSWDNLTPLYQRANTPAMRTCEGYLKRLVTECKYCVTVHVQVQGYGQNMSVPAAARPAMPTRVVIDWVTDCGTQQGTFTIDNVTTAAVQDPCRVANLPCRP